MIAQHNSLSFSCVVNAACLSCSRINARPLLYKCTRSNTFPWHRKSYCANGAPGLSNSGAWATTAKKCAKTIQPARVWSRTALGFQAEEPVRKHLPILHQSSTSGDPTLRPLHIWGGEWLSWHKVVTGNWNTTSVTAKEHKSTNCLKKLNHILWMRLASHRLSVVALTLWSWTMDGNSSAPTQSFPLFFSA